MSSSRKAREFADLLELISWLEYDSHNAFASERTELLTLYSLMFANEDVKCDNEEVIGMAVREKLNNVSLHAASINRYDQTHPIGMINLTLGIGDG